MFNATSLFKERLRAHVKLLNRYLRYIFNGHFMIAILFIIVTLAVYYQRWLAEVSASFPATFVIAVLFTIVVLYNPIQSFLKVADKVFLIVKEEEMNRYFLYSLLYNYSVQLYVVIFVVAAVGPLYFEFYPETNSLVTILLIAVILLIKGWNLALRWRSLQMDNQTFVLSERIVRTVLTFLLFYSLLSYEYLLVIGVVYIVYINVVYLYMKKNYRLNWERLIDNDSQRLAKFYRFVSLFAEVPHAKSRLRKRSLLTKLVRKQTAFNQASSFTYLYRLTFLRSGDYFSLFIRLTVLAIIVIVFVTNVWLKLALAILFMYMTSFQLHTLYYHYRTNVWVDLYPLNPEDKKSAFLSLTMQLSQVQALILALSFLGLGEWLLSVIMLLAGSVFNLMFNQLYIKKKIDLAI